MRLILEPTVGSEESRESGRKVANKRLTGNPAQVASLGNSISSCRNEGKHSAYCVPLGVA